MTVEVTISEHQHPTGPRRPSPACTFPGRSAGRPASARTAPAPVLPDETMTMRSSCLYRQPPVPAGSACRAESGFSLIEVMVASLIVILVMYGLMQFFVRGRIQVDYEEDRRKATAVAQELDRADASLGLQLTWSAASRTTVRAANDTTFVVDGRTYKAAFAVSYDKTVERVPGRVDGTAFPGPSIVDYNQANPTSRSVTVTTLSGKEATVRFLRADAGRRVHHHRAHDRELHYPSSWSWPRG